DAEPVALDGADDGEHLLRRRGDAAVILEGKIDAELAGVLAAFLDRLDAALAGALLNVAPLHRAGEDAHRLAAQARSVLDPILNRRNLLSEARGICAAEIVSDRRAADVQAQPCRPSLEPGEIALRRFRKIIGRQL